MALSILNNIPSLAAQNQLSITGSSLQKTLFRLSSGSRINSGADDAAGLAIADGLRANVTALSQSARNATDGIGKLQVADGALSQVTSLLNRAVTLATEASTGTVNSTQRAALDAEYTQIKAEIDRIGSKTTFNGDLVFSGTPQTDTNAYSGDAAVTLATAITDGQVFSITDTDTGNVFTVTAASDTVGTLIGKIQNATAAGTINVNASIDGSSHFQVKDASGNHSLYISTDMAALGTVSASTVSGGNSSVYLSDGGATTGGTISTSIGALSSTSLGLAASLNDAATSQTALTQVSASIAAVASSRGTIGAGINRLQSASNVITTQVQNLSAAEDGIRAADIAQEVANMTKFNILNQTGISALSQANQMQQGVLSLLR